MNRPIRSLAGLAAAATAMYLFDPSSGRRRRARLRDQLLSFAIRLDEGVAVAVRDISQRLRGMLVSVRRSFERDGAGDDVLVERVRSCMGRAVSHPGAVEVSASNGQVVLQGAILAHEHERLLTRLRSVRGVASLDDRLLVYENAEGVSALQGGRTRRPSRFDFLQESWSPATRLLAGTAGGALFLYGLRSRGFAGLASSGVGGALLLRTATNMPLKRLAGATGRRTIDIHKTICVHAPVQTVFETLAHYENFPAFMRNVRKVKLHEDGRSHWTVAGPAGASVTWEAETTRYEPHRLLAWRTVPRSIVEHAGIIRFEPLDNNQSTRLDIQMSYSPPVGALGHVVAKLFGSDPKTELDEDLLRLKSFLETGKSPRDAAGDGRPSVQAPREMTGEHSEPMH